ncbi:MAG: ribosome small subunit-dependent GTPase A [Clostridia bacterium]|nr:ribosome small subunit-dependent GTPase A [Clostridia bacterium]
MKIKEGKILKGIGGFYYVDTSDGVFECRARGKFRKDSIIPYVGDNVRITVDADGSGYVTEIFDRKNAFVRPPIANVDKLLIVSASANPSPDTLFIDKMLVTAQAGGVTPALCFNKADLNDSVLELADLYSAAGYKVFVTSAIDNYGIDNIINFMGNSITALCGFSGVGKSSILNLITNSTNFQVGEISLKLSRGKHTTRHVELVKMAHGTYLADTPGFSMISIPNEIDPSHLIDYFPDLSKYANCKFGDCSHTSAKHCGVYEAVSRGMVSHQRYENYKTLYNSLKDNKEWIK